MARRTRQRLAGWVLSAVAVALAAAVGGWVFRSAEEPESNASSSVGTDDPATQDKPVNRLANETSPYLQLHKHNPVQWYPWCPEAFEKAKREEKPIFLSIGYTACHWCHVMERESFNDLEIAKTLNENFVPVKVDREERPDVDDVYMSSVRAMGHMGGWPLSVFLTPDLKPFFGGTYWPPNDDVGRPGFRSVLQTVSAWWRDRRGEVEAQAETVAHAMKQAAVGRNFSFRRLDRQTIAQAVQELADQFDPEFGGFGYDRRRANLAKFPQPGNLALLLYQFRQTGDPRIRGMVSFTLHRMAHGGIWDMLGGGFHRYSTDRFWRVPHFEKMLYDNAQLARVYIEASELTGDRSHGHIATRVFEFVDRELTSPEGGFYSALDADSEDEEGKYYVWTEQELKGVLLPQEFELFAAFTGMKVVLDTTGTSNLERRYVLQPADSAAKISEQLGVSVGDLAARLEPAMKKLLAAREHRPRPLCDTKILTDWNGLMIAALADGYRRLGNVEYRKSAERAAELILTKLRDADGRLLHTYAEGSAKLPAFLEDYAFLIDGLLALYRATNEPRWLDEARALSDQMVKLFWDESSGGFYQTAADQEVVLVRTKPSDDSDRPAGNSAAAAVLVELARTTGEMRYAELAGRTIGAFAGTISLAPGLRPDMVRALGEYLDANFPTALLASRPPSRDPEVLRARASVSQDKLEPGREFHLDVDFIIDREWHIYANPASRREYRPTTIEISSELPLDDVRIAYPSARPFQPDGSAESIAVYSGENKIRVSAKLREDASKGKSEIKLSLHYQACNNQLCLAPKTLQLTVPVEVMAGGGQAHPSPSDDKPNEPPDK